MNVVRSVAGMVLVVVGAGIIGYGIYDARQVFSGDAPPPSLFQLPQKDSFLPKGIQGGVDAQIQSLLAQQLEGMIPFDAVPKALNVSMYALFVALLFLGGGQMAGIGIKLLRP